MAVIPPTLPPKIEEERQKAEAARKVLHPFEDKGLGDLVENLFVIRIAHPIVLDLPREKVPESMRGIYDKYHALKAEINERENLYKALAIEAARI